MKKVKLHVYILIKYFFLKTDIYVSLTDYAKIQK